MAKQEFPEWAKTLYRGVRAAFAAGIAHAWILQPDWSNLEESLKVVGTAFLTGFIVSFGKWIREFLDEKFGFDEKSVPAKFMPI